MTDSASSAPGPTGVGAGRQPGLAATLALYTLARLGLLAVLTALLVLAGVPVLLALLLGLIVALPLSLVVFRGLRGRLDSALADAGKRRSAEREALRARLRGDEPPADHERVDVPGTAADWSRPDGPRPSGDEAQRQPDAGRG